MYKGDLCRGIKLYQYEGLYFDVDVGVRHINIFHVINNKQEQRR